MSPLQPGQMMGPYRLINEIGKGGMAIVWKGYHASMDRYVAIKMLPYQFAQRDEFLARFRQEARVIAKLEHPHILPVYDYGEGGDKPGEVMPYLVMRLLDAGTLTDRIRAGGLSLSEVDHIFTQLADALGYAHEKGVIHRDIKPSNAMLDQRGEIFLTDFGIAKIVESAAQLTATGTITGTPEYMSPEQAQGLKIDHRTDIYSLGVVLYEMLTGQVPYHAETPIAVILKKIQDPLPPPSVVNPDIPDPLEPVLLKALTKEPQDRFGSMRDFLAAWKRALADCMPTTVAKKETVLVAEEKVPIAERPISAVKLQSTGSFVGERIAERAPTTTDATGSIGSVPLEKAPGRAPARGSTKWVWVVVGAGLLVVLCGIVLVGFMMTRAVKNRAVATSTQYVMAVPPPMQETAAVGDLPTEPLATQIAQPVSTMTPEPSITLAPSSTPPPAGLPPTINDPLGGGLMVLVPEGAFQMGSNLEEVMNFCPGHNHGKACKLENYIGENGIHTVFLESFYIDQYEVTNRSYAQCVAAKKCESPVDTSLGTQDFYFGNSKFESYPVVHVTWFQAQKYCAWRGGRLPTEAEWEKAARGTDQLYFPWGNDFIGAKANLCDVNCTGETVNPDINDGYPYTAPVGSFPDGQSPYGAYDMAGNVWEWVFDWYAEDFYSTQQENTRSPSGPASGSAHVLRGGSWISNMFNLRTSLRLAYKPDFQAAQIGFRCVRDP